MAHAVLMAQPAYVEWETEGAELAKQRAYLAEQAVALLAPHAVAVEGHAAAVQAALDAGDPIPPVPTPPSMGHLDLARSLLEQKEQAHRARRDAVLTECATAGALAGLTERESIRQGRFAQLAPELAELQAEAELEARAMSDLLAAIDREADVRVFPSRAERLVLRHDLTQLIAAAVEERTLLEPGPVQHVRPRVVMVDDGRDARRVGFEQAQAAGRLGFQEPPTFAKVPPWPPGQRLT